MLDYSKTSLFALALVALVASTGCQDAFDRIHCDEMCKSYKECEDDELDRTQCEKDCFDAIDGDEELEDDARDCGNCVDSILTSCSEISDECETCDDVMSIFIEDYED